MIMLVSALQNRKKFDSRSISMANLKRLALGGPTGVVCRLPIGDCGLVIGDCGATESPYWSVGTLPVGYNVRALGVCRQDGHIGGP